MLNVNCKWKKKKAEPSCRGRAQPEERGARARTVVGFSDWGTWNSWVRIVRPWRGGRGPVHLDRCWHRRYFPRRPAPGRWARSFYPRPAEGRGQCCVHPGSTQAQADTLLTVKRSRPSPFVTSDPGVRLPLLHKGDGELVCERVSRLLWAPPVAFRLEFPSNCSSGASLWVCSFYGPPLARESERCGSDKAVLCCCLRWIVDFLRSGTMDF